MTITQCASYCDQEPTCVGYAYNGGCILYGPGLDQNIVSPFQSSGAYNGPMTTIGGTYEPGGSGFVCVPVAGRN
jgi:hypothetical protein